MEKKMFRLTVEEDYTAVLKEVYNSIVMETAEGNRIALCMRDDTFEIGVLIPDSDTRWFRVDQTTHEIIPMLRGSLMSDGRRR
jgi:hypothetical protein